MPRKATGPKLREDGVLRAILQYLALRKDVVVWRQNSGSIMVPGQGGKARPLRFGTPGCADLTGLIKPWGVRLEIEVKRPEGGKQLPAQKAFEAQVRDAGGMYLLVRSVEELEKSLLFVKNRLSVVMGEPDSLIRG